VNATNVTLYQKLNFDFIRDIAPVASIMRVPNVMEVNPAVPVRNVPEFIAYAKANPGKVNYGSGGAGSGAHISAELFKMMAGVEMVHIPYRGVASAVADLLGGQLQLMFDSMLVHRTHQGRQTDFPGGHDRDPLGIAARIAHNCRVHARV
jgi:tripartite-type tricarboxylate transporter receptor subunit TctC